MSAAVRAHLLVLLLLPTLLAGGCELFEDSVPCTPGNHHECAAGQLCGVDGFCRATGVPDDAGALADAGAADAGEPPDAGGDVDSGPVIDGGAPDDDAGVPDDAGAPGDAGDDADAGEDDAGYDAGAPELPCGNGVLNVDETCDDGRNDDGDGCDAECMSETGWLCIGSPSVCEVECGDGILLDGEECDDGPDGNSDTAPDACRTDCTAARCGDGVIDSDVTRAEICDGAALSDFYCLERGYLPSATQSCTASCDDLDVSTCGEAIDDTASLRAALLAAYERDAPSVVALAPATFIIDDTVVVDDTVGAAHGVVLRPLAGAVSFEPALGFANALLRLASAGHQVEGLNFVNASRAIEVFAPDNVIERSSFTNAAGFSPQDLIYLTAGDNVVQHNRFRNTTGSISGRAIHATDENNLVVVRNLIQGIGSGAFSEAIRIVGNNPTASRVTFVQHNTVDGSGNYVGIHLEALGQLCFHDNVLTGNTPTRALRLNGTLTLGTDAKCTVTSQKNGLFGGMNTRCEGTPCATLCDGAGPLCDLGSDPDFDGDGCLSATSALIDVGVDVGRPPIDEGGIAVGYTGDGPDVGAREAGTSSAYGGATTACPDPAP